MALVTSEREASFSTGYFTIIDGVSLGINGGLVLQVPTLSKVETGTSWDKN